MAAAAPGQLRERDLSRLGRFLARSWRLALPLLLFGAAPPAFVGGRGRPERRQGQSLLCQPQRPHLPLQWRWALPQAGAAPTRLRPPAPTSLPAEAARAATAAASFSLASAVEGGSAVAVGRPPALGWRPHRARGRGSVRLGASDPEQQEADDLESDPNWQKVREEMTFLWSIRDHGDFVDVDDIKVLLDEHLRSIVGAARYEELWDMLFEVSETEPDKGKVSKEDFVELAGAFVYNQLYDVH